MTSVEENGFIWMDGEYIPWQDAKVHLLTHTLHYGVGVFEGVRGYETDKGTAIFRLDDHTRRLFKSAHIVSMDIPFDKDTLNAVQKEIVAKNKLRSAYLRPVCYYGDEGRGLHAEHLKTHVAIASWAWGAYLGKENLERGVRIMTSGIQRINPCSAMTKAKANGNYINSVMALQDAVKAGYDEALMLDHQGYVAEGSGENIFIVRDDILYTPPLTNVLEGITRDTIIKLATDLGYDVKEQYFTRDFVYGADEAFFTGTAAEVTPIRELDNRQIGIGQRGPITEQLQTLYFDVVHGKVPSYDHWLTYIATP